MFGDELPHGFEAIARVLKPSGKIEVMPKGNVTKIVSRQLNDGTPLQRKVLFKVPNLAAGDILQIEFTLTRIFTESASGIFYYNANDFILYSNLYVTLPMKCTAKYYSFPQSEIGEPQVQQVSKNFGTGKTYFWSLRNLNPIPDEPHSLPFTDRSLMTAFVVEKWENTKDSFGDWVTIAQKFYENYLDKDNVASEQIEKLGFSKNEGDSLITFAKTDKLYSALSKAVALQENNSLYPLSKKIGSVFKTGKGDASDLSYAMFNILQQWKQNANIVWIRDQREGNFEKTVPTTIWFDRLGVLVTIDGKEKLYDFDRSIPTAYCTPWYLKPIDIVVIDKNGCQQRTIHESSKCSDNVLAESHKIVVDESSTINDKVHFVFKGAPAEEFRFDNYGIEKEEIKKEIHNSLIKYCLSSVDSVVYNNFWDEATIELYSAGLSKSKVTAIDSFLVFKIYNHTLSDFKNDIFSTHRNFHVNLEVPFQLSMRWDVIVPAGYRVKNLNKSSRFQGPTKIISEFNYTIDQNTFTILVNMIFPEKMIHYSEYTQLISIIDKTLEQINQDIILQKI